MKVKGHTPLRHQFKLGAADIYACNQFLDFQNLGESGQTPDFQVTEQPALSEFKGDDSALGQLTLKPVEH